MLIKSIKFGFVLGINSYLKDNWNKLDFFVVLISILNMILINQNLNFLKILRILRIFRILRLISQN